MTSLVELTKVKLLTYKIHLKLIKSKKIQIFVDFEMLGGSVP